MKKIRTKSYIEKLLPELKPNSEPKLIVRSFCPNNTKPAVACS